ncbi:srpa-72 [Symbiodinium necroappetens]|uniref:Srpa-72 protein n=1 Tax=Symbiodinium necroappetens TaxID=1628268 RepID=A0A813APZ1_9DINO|nr:srpa-72 [Symbiodinium necroappetens]
MPRSKKLQVESDYTQATESWIARIPSDDTLQERRQQRNRIVVANRITSRETIRAAFKGKSLLEERWIGNLDDSAADTELSVPSVIAWLRRTDLYANTALTHVEVLNFVQQILAGHEVNAVCNVAGRRGRTVSAIQFQAIIHWIAKHKGISYSECITKLVHHPNERTRLEHYFEEFAHASSHGFMTVYEFTRFCRAFGLFQLRPGRFVEGDVQFLFDLGDEGKAVDLEGFRRVLEKVAERLDLPAQELLHFLGEKDAERVFREGMDSAGLRRKAVVYQSYLENIDGSDYEALCGLVQALAVTDPERATEYAERLQVPAFDHLDPEELEAQPIPKVGAMFSQRRRDREDEADGKPVRVKKKRKRKIRYPKGFDPENPGPPPDPERWLPKRERSEFKKKMRKRDKHLLRGPQGAITTEDFRKQGPSTAQVEVSKDASGPSRRSGRKAKGK